MYATTQNTKPQPVTVVNFDVGFLQLVWLMIKIAFASIPAMIVVFTVATMLGLFFSFVITTLGLVGTAALSL